MMGGLEIGEFLGIPYEARRNPATESIQNFLSDKERGANCELFALGFLRAAGFKVEEKRSIELWHDRDFTVGVENDSLRPFDILFFLPKGTDPHRVAEEVARGAYHEDINDLKKFHLGVYLGKFELYNASDCVLHLPKPGPSAVWRLEDFAVSEKEYWLFMVKRPFALKDRESDATLKR